MQDADAPRARHRVVVVGGGFGGLPASRLLARTSNIDVTLIDRRNHHLFQPLLYQVATGILSPGQIAPPLRHVHRHNRNVKVLLAEVTGFDIERRVVHATRPPNEPIEVIYDSLIVAAGASQSYFGNDHFALYAPGMKTIDDALELRRRIFGAFEMAETAETVEDRAQWLTIALVGAGPTGVELAGQIRELATRSLRGEFRNFDASSVRVLLLDGGDEPLATFGDKLSGKATRSLEKMGVELRMGTRVTGVDASGVDVTTSEGDDGFPRDGGLGGRCPGIPPGRNARRGHRSRGRSSWPDRCSPRSQPPRSPRDLRGGRHDVPRPSSRRRRGGDAGWSSCRPHHHATS